MKRLFFMMCLSIGLFLSINGTLLATNRHPDAKPLEWLYYVARDSQQVAQLYRLQPELAFRQAIRHQTPSSLVSISPNRRILIFSADNDLYSSTYDGSNWQRLTHNPHQAKTIAGWAGDYLLFYQAEAVYRVYPDGRHLQQIATVSNMDTPLHQWTSDGAWFFWRDYHPNGVEVVGQTLNSPPSHLFNHADFSFSSITQIASDNQAFYVQGQGGDDVQGFYRVPLTGGEPILLDDPPQQPRYFATDSPDGAWLYYHQAESGQYTLYVMRSDLNGTARQVLQGRERHTLHFSPDAQWLLAISHDLIQPTFYLLRPDGSEKRELARNYMFFKWTGDGRFILSIQADQFYLLDTDGHATPLPFLSSEVLSVQIVGDWIIYQDRQATYYRYDTRTQQTQVLMIGTELILSFTRQALPPHPIPHKALAVGLAMLSLSLIFAYKFRVFRYI